MKEFSSSVKGVKRFVSGGLFVLFFCSSIIAQKNTASIKGRITDVNNNPAAGITVSFGRKTNLTNADGYFLLQQLQSGSDTLVISSVEFKPITRNITLKEDETLDAGVIHLEYNVRQLEDVEITGRTRCSYKSDYSFFSSKTETSSQNIPQAISSLTKELIQDKMELTLKDAVDEVAGVNQYSGYDEYTIRGFRAENARDINGLRGYNTTYTSPMLVNIERIEVIKGPTATLYGNCDPGGTINLVTKKPLRTKQGSINTYAGKWNHYRFESDVTGPVNRTKTLLYRLNAGYDNTKSFRNNVGAASYEIAPSVSFIPNDKLKMNVDLSLSHINTVLDRGQPGYEDNESLRATPINLSLVQKGDYLHETDIASNLSLSYKLSNRLAFNSGYLHYYASQKTAEHGLSGYLVPDSVALYYTRWKYPSHTNTLTNYFTYKINETKLSHEVLLGYDFVSSTTELSQQYYELPEVFGEGSGIVGTFSLKNPVYAPRPVQDYRLSDFDNDATNVDAGSYRTHGVYLQDQMSIGKWKFLLSIREEFYKNRDGSDEDGENSKQALSEKVFLPRVGIVYSVKPNISLYATYNKGFDPFEVSTATQQFEEAFKPITSKLLEAGAKANFFRNNLSASLSLYDLTLRNVAVNASDISNPNLFVQGGEDRSRGIETEVTGNVLPNLSVYLTYAYSECKIIKSKIATQVGLLAENAPRHTSGSYVKYTIAKGTLKGLGFSAGHSSVSERNTLDPDFTLPGYLTFNAGVQYTCHRYKVAFLLNNFTNKTYWTAAYNNRYKWPGEPVNGMVNVSYQF